MRELFSKQRKGDGESTSESAGRVVVDQIFSRHPPQGDTGAAGFDIDFQTDVSGDDRL